MLHIFKRHFDSTARRIKLWISNILVCFLRMTSIKRRIVSSRYLYFAGYPLQLLIFHETDMTPWARFPKPAKQKLATTNSFRVFGGSVFAHPSPDILNKHNIKETANKRNIWSPLYIPKDEGSGGG